MIWVCDLFTRWIRDLMSYSPGELVWILNSVNSGLIYSALTNQISCYIDGIG